MFGQRLRLARKKAGFSMRDLAGADVVARLSAQAISQLRSREDAAQIGGVWLTSAGRSMSP